MTHRALLAPTLALLIAASLGACSEAPSPPEPAPVETEPGAGQEAAEPQEAKPEKARERVPRAQLMRMFVAAAELCTERTDTHERACVSEEVCRAYCDRMIPDSHGHFMSFPCGGQHTEVCYEAVRPTAGSPAVAAAQAADVDDPTSKCWMVTAHGTGKSVLACGRFRLSIAWVSE